MAGTRARRERAAGRISALLHQVSWDMVRDDLQYQALLPVLGGRLVEAAEDRVPATFAAAVRGETAASHERGAMQELITLRVAAALEAAAVPNVPLKGPLLARALYGDPGMRYSGDIDVLVRRDQLEAAARALESLGWTPAPGRAPDPVLHLILLHDRGLPDIELHWRVHWYEAELGARAHKRALVDSNGIRRLQPADELAALLLYHARDGFAGLRYPIDIGAWWDRYGASGEPPVVQSVVDMHPDLRPALEASAAVVQRLVALPAGALLTEQRLARGPRQAIRLANPLMRGRPQQITAEVSLVDGLLSPKGQRIAFLKRRALPSAHELPATERPIAVARAEHLMRLLRRYIVTLFRSRPRLPAGVE